MRESWWRRRVPGSTFEVPRGQVERGRRVMTEDLKWVARVRTRKPPGACGRRAPDVEIQR
jgi:hypothetical protein